MMDKGAKVSMDAERIASSFEAAWGVVQDAVAASHLPSAVLAVANAEETLAIRQTGPNGDGSIKLDAIFLLASVTKPIVATAILQLVEHGDLLLHEPVANLWPEFAANGKEQVTLWHLLTHTSGLKEDFGRPTASDLRAWETEAVRATGLDFPPGSRYRYCTASFRVMTALIERLTGQPYDAYLEEKALRPIGMADTTFAPRGALASRAMPVLDLPWPLESFVGLAAPGAGYWSTAADLIAFGQAYLNQGMGRHGRVLGPTTVAAATRVQYEGVEDEPPIPPATVYRGLGWAVVGPDNAELLPIGAYRHGGATGTQLLVDPTNGLVLVFLTNRWGIDGRWRNRAMNAFYSSS
jgi:CubicO group peptidase (beta-lactamase class C family)